MYNTRFMNRMFSATMEGDEELTDQVANDIETAKDQGAVDTDEVVYEDAGDGKVAITDKGNGEVTIAEQGEEGNYDLYPYYPTQNLEGYLHPGEDGVTPGNQRGGVYESYRDHLPEDFSWSDYDNLAYNGEYDDEDDSESREFSVSTDNAVVSKIFSDQAFCERIFSEVIDSEETAKVGELKIEKDPDEDNTVIVTNETTGDQAKVVLDDDEMEVTELDSKNFGDCCGYCGDDDDVDQYHVVGVDTDNHMLVNSVEFDQDSAEDLAARLEEDGVDAVKVLEDGEDARDYADSLLENMGVDSSDEVGEPEEATYSDHTVYFTKYYSNNTLYMDRLFSEEANGIEDAQEDIETSIEKGEQVETDDEVITPVGESTAVVEDKNTGEFTKVVLKGDAIDSKPISEDEADRLTEDINVEKIDGIDDDDDEEDEDEEKEFSDLNWNYDGTKLFSDYEYMTDYMERLFSDEADTDEEDIADAIESGEEVETDETVITPVDDDTAVIEDKESGEYTKATLGDDDKVELEGIDEDEAQDLLEDISVEEHDDEDEDDDEEDEKKFSEYDFDYDYDDDYGYYDDKYFAVSDDDESLNWNYDGTKLFSDYEYMTDYMERLFSDEADTDEEDIADAIESGEEVETDETVITPVDDDTAVIEDKESGEYTKATLGDDDKVELEGIDDDEAQDLLEDISVEEHDDEDEDEDDDDDEEDEKKFSDFGYYDYFYDNPMLDKFFADVPQGGQPVPGQPAPDAQMQEGGEQPQYVDENGNPIEVDENGNPIQPEEEPQQMPPLESIEDKAVAAVQSIQAAAAEAESMIMNAKAAPVQEQSPDLQEAQFSWFDDYGYNENDSIYQKTFSDSEDTLVSFLNNI